MRIPVLVVLALSACDPATDGPGDDTDTDTDTVDTTPTDTDDSDTVDTEVVDTTPVEAQPMAVTITPSEPLAGEALTCAADTTTEVLYTWLADGVAAGITTAQVPAGTADAYTTWTCEAVTVDGLYEGTATVDVAEPCLALQADGVDGFAAIIPRADFNRTAADFTVEAWVWRASTDTVDDVVSHTGLLDASPGRTDYLLRFTADDVLVFATGAPAEGDDCTWMEEPAPTAEAWHHIEASWEVATGRKRLWIDGLLARTCLSSTRGTNASGSFNVGASFQITGVLNAFHGSLDEVRLSSVVRHTVPFVPDTWKRPDADTIVLLHANDTIPGTPPGTPDASAAGGQANLAGGITVGDAHSACDVAP